MAVSNKLQKQSEKKSSQLVSFEVNGSTVELSPQIVREYLVSGDKERVTMKEIVMFINMCKFNGLNPWLREAYCVKYGNEPATIVTGKEAFEKRAENHPSHDGHKAGIVVVKQDSDEPIYRTGALVLPDETIVGGWAEVWRKDQKETTRIEVGFDEYAGRKKDGHLNRQWSSKPATMIRKVALVQALREAFPKTFGGMYTADEQDIAENVIDVTPVDVQDVPDVPAVNAETGEIIEEAPATAAADPTADFFNQEG